MYKSVPEIFFPMLWFEQTVEMPDSIASDLRMLLMMPMIGRVTAVFIILIGVFMVTFALTKSLFTRRKAIVITKK